MFRALLSLALASFALLASAARYPSYGTLQTINSSGVLNVMINNTYSSVNLFDLHIQSDLANLIETLQANDTDIRVAVFSSANKDSFLAHININYFLPGYGASLTFNFLMACDMRFASTSPSVILSQLETSLGTNPGAAGAMYLSHLIGRGRTFEYVLSSYDVDTVTAERIGWINTAFATSSELHTYVQGLAARIALFPAAGIAGMKQEINAVNRPPREVSCRIRRT
ncbi:ClpP/crotonase-like domain-containing protein [Mycena rosella]|uniref:ClpP/crotonase-like domain-containing protein n=1 Tax=Mycena rosella TaxID=1033263 RepID=A0AAD7F7H5_MYCRO|nr:ClpP/crotonase-like domain-containing protein [Mycena rosella]